MIDYLQSLHTNDISLKLLSYKTVMLLKLLSGQRVSNLHYFRIDELQSRESEDIFNVTALLKHDKVSRKKESIIFYAYPHNVQLCSVHIINQYRRVRDALVPSTEKAFLSPMANHIMLLRKTHWHDGLRMFCPKVGWIRQCSIHTTVVLPPLPRQNRRGYHYTRF